MSDESKQHMVLTAVGPDRPGLVKEVSALIHRAGANLEDSRMAVLAGEFALIVLFAAPPAAVEQIQRESRKLKSEFDFKFTFKSTHHRQQVIEHRLYYLEVTGVDQPGIVLEVSDVLAQHHINVISLESRLRHASFSGTPLFSLWADLEVPSESDLEELRLTLERVCEAKDLSFAMEPVKPQQALR